MPFMRGALPLRRTLYHLKQAKVVFRDEVKIFTFAYHEKPNPAQRGAKNFMSWHWGQLLFNNPRVQLVRFNNISVLPFALALLRDGREVPFDLEWKTQDEIINMLQSTLGNTPLVRKRDHLEKMLNDSPANFGSNCQRQCICEVQGQHPCTSLMYAPKYLKETWRWSHANYNPEKPRIHPPPKYSLFEIDRDPPQ